MAVFFTSDLHLYHRAVSYIRRYGSWPQDKSLVTPEDVEWHNDLLAQRWDNRVSEGDVVWILGDLIANAKHLPQALDWIYERPGTKHFVLGNHDPAHPMHSESHKWESRYREAFESVSIARKRQIAMADGSRQEVLLSHFPYTGDGDSKAEDRDTQWRLRNEGLPILHGHTHSNEKLTYGIVERYGGGEGPYIMAVAMQVHVGLDAWNYAPVSLEQVAEVLDRVVPETTTAS
jgi:calcineurin-like phosphoesterase family protein